MNSYFIAFAVVVLLADTCHADPECKLKTDTTGCETLACPDNGATTVAGNDGNTTGTTPANGAGNGGTTPAAGGVDTTLADATTDATTTAGGLPVGMRVARAAEDCSILDQGACCNDDTCEWVECSSVSLQVAMASLLLGLLAAVILA